MSIAREREQTTGYLRFALFGLGAAGLVALAGWVPTQRWAGDGAASALVAALSVVTVGSLIGGLPTARLRRTGGDGPRAVLSVLGATAARTGSVVVLASAVAVAGLVPARPFLLWTAISYLALLPVDVAYALTATRTVAARGEEESTR